MRISTAEEKILGTEPTFDTPLEVNDVRWGRVLNWYNYHYKTEEYHEWIKEYAKRQKIKSHFSRPIPRFFCITARLLNRGIKLPVTMVKSLELFLNEPQIKEVEKPTPIIQKRIENKVSQVIADIDDKLDEFYRNNCKPIEFSAYDLLVSMDTKANQGHMILGYFARIEGELNDVIQGDNKDLKEGYSRFSKAQIKASFNFLHTICLDISRHMSNEKIAKVRKPRTPKAKSGADLVKKLKFKKADPEFKLVSIDPTQIIGAKELWVFNTEKRKLIQYTSKGGLSVKGTTILNFDEKSSIAKTIRKPEEILPKFFGAGKIMLRNFLQQINTKESPANGRISEDCILLKAGK